jgi:hypothetical protein
MKVVRIDENAHRILVNVKKEMEKQGIENPDLSQAVRKLAEWAKFKIETPSE